MSTMSRRKILKIIENPTADKPCFGAFAISHILCLFILKGQFDIYTLLFSCLVIYGFFIDPFARLMFRVNRLLGLKLLLVGSLNIAALELLSRYPEIEGGLVVIAIFSFLFFMFFWSDWVDKTKGKYKRYS